MEQNINSNKTPARPSHEAIESKLEDSKLEGRTDQERMDQVANKAARRANNRIVYDETNLPGKSEFTK